MEYGNVAIMGASVTQLSRFNTVQNTATTLCYVDLVPLQCRHHAAEVELLLKLLDYHCRELLQIFCPNFLNSKCDIAFHSTQLVG